jgi:hypothetical protein
MALASINVKLPGPSFEKGAGPGTFSGGSAEAFCGGERLIFI